MTMVMKYVLCVAIIAASLRNVRAISKDEMAEFYKKVLPHITDCSKEHGLAEGALKDAHEKKTADGIDPCFFACVFKKSELMDDKGMFLPETALKKLKEDLSNEDDIKKATEVVKECSAVNSEDVNDGNAGCDRAMLMVQCLAKHKQMFFTE